MRRAVAVLILVSSSLEAQELFFKRLVGAPGGTRMADGPAASARLEYPTAIVCDDPQRIYFHDYGRIRSLANGEVTTLAGRNPETIDPYKDGRGGRVILRSVTDLASDGSSLWIFDNYAIREVHRDGVVRSPGLAVTPNSFYEGGGGGLVRLGDGSFLAGDYGQRVLWKFAPNPMVFAGTPNTTGTDDGPAATARFVQPRDLSMDANGSVWMIDERAVRILSSDGVVSHVAGSYGQSGSNDGYHFEAKFDQPLEIAAAPDGSAWVADWSNGLRRVTRDRRVVSVVDAPPGVYFAAVCVDPAGVVYAGTASAREAAIVKIVDGRAVPVVGIYDSHSGTPTDGPAETARLRYPGGLTLDGAANAYTIDWGGLRKITPGGVVTTIHRNASGSELVLAPDGSFFVTGFAGVNRIAPDGSTTRLAGGTTQGAVDGKGADARFRDVHGIVIGKDGALYVADTLNYAIRRVALDGTVTTFAGTMGVQGTEDGTGTAARFTRPYSLAVDTQGNLFVSDDRRVRKVTPAGVVSTFAEISGGLAVDGSGNLYVANGRTIQRVSPAGAKTLVAGTFSRDGNDEGDAATVRFAGAYSLAVDAMGRFVVVDSMNHSVFVSLEKLRDAAGADRLAPSPGTPVQLRVDRPTAGASYRWRQTRKPASSQAALSATDIATPTFVPDVPDVFTFELTASTATGMSVSTVTITASEPSPKAAFDGTALGLVVNFRDRSTGWPTEWTWVFGDGATSAERNPQHEYEKEGNYTVKLTVRNGSGTNTVSQAVTVKASGRRRAARH